MAINIDTANVTESRVEGDGVFDVFMRAVRAHIKDAVDTNEISQAEAGQIYTSVIPAVLQNAIEFTLRKEITSLQIDQEQVKLNILNNEEYVSNNNKIISDKEAAIKELDRKMKEEEAGGTIMKYYYWFSYINWKNEKVYVEPLDANGNLVETVPAGSETVTETVTFYGYKDSLGNWVNTGKDYEEMLSQEIFHLTYIDNSVFVDTKVPYLPTYKGIEGDSFILRSKSGGIIIVFKNSDDGTGTSTPITYIGGSYDVTFENLLYQLEDPANPPKTITDWVTLFNDYIANPADVRFVDVSVFLDTEIMPSDANQFNYIESFKTVLCDGTDWGDGLGIRPLYQKDYTYKVTVDKARIYKAVPTTEVGESVISKKLREIEAKIALANEQVSSFRFNNYLKGVTMLGDVWAAGFSAAPTAEYWPDTFTRTKFDGVLNDLREEISKFTSQS